MESVYNKTRLPAFKNNSSKQNSSLQNYFSLNKLTIWIVLVHFWARYWSNQFPIKSTASRFNSNPACDSQGECTIGWWAGEMRRMHRKEINHELRRVAPLVSGGGDSDLFRAPAKRASLRIVGQPKLCASVSERGRECVCERERKWEGMQVYRRVKLGNRRYYYYYISYLALLNQF